MTRHRPKAETVSVMFCCNDERGYSAGRVVKVDVEDDGAMIEVEAPGFPDAGPRFATGYQRVKLSRRQFYLEPRSYRTHVGNVFWDGARLARAEARRLLAYLLSLGWTVTAGPVETDLLQEVAA